MMSEVRQTAEWVAAAQQGDRLALAKLLTLSHPALRARVECQMEPALRARSGPDDILQEVYIDVARQIRRFENRGPGAFYGWLNAIVTHKLLDARRAIHCQARDVRREVHPAADSASCWNLLDDVYAESGTPSRAVRREEAMDAMLSCLGGLADIHRLVIQLRFLDGLSLDEVAARVGRSRDAVASLSTRALAALRNAMQQRGEFTRCD